MVKNMFVKTGTIELLGILAWPVTSSLRSIPNNCEFLLIIKKEQLGKLSWPKSYAPNTNFDIQILNQFFILFFICGLGLIIFFLVRIQKQHCYKILFFLHLFLNFQTACHIVSAGTVDDIHAPWRTAVRKLTCVVCDSADQLQYYPVSSQQHPTGVFIIINTVASPWQLQNRLTLDTLHRVLHT